jgi:hypothetical protein
MRALAYIMLILGFIWICLCQLEIGLIAEATTANQFLKLPKQQYYTLEEVHKVCHDVAVDVARNIPMFSIGGLLMLGGSILLDTVGRRKQVPR